MVVYSWRTEKDGFNQKLKKLKKAKDIQVTDLVAWDFQIEILFSSVS